MDGPLVTFGDNNKGFIVGYGNQFTDRGFKVSFEKGECSIINKKTGEVALKGARKGSLFVADLYSTNKDSICYFYTKASIKKSKLWHKKLYHQNYKAINTLVKKELVRDMPNLEFAHNEVCEACQKVKMKRSSHKNKAVNSISAPLQLIHIDLFGPINVLSISKKKYTFVMVDDYLRYTWVEFMHSKNETSHIIIEHIKKVEKQAEDQNYVKRLRSDNSTEFRNVILIEFCKGKGIVQEFSAARIPQQNKVVERKNRTLVEAARIMVQDANLPAIFWEKAVNIACYTPNKYLINKNLGKSPYSILSRRKPTVKHLNVFGSKCHVLKDNSEYVGKFDCKVFEEIFLGYSLE
ncbi:hypothetical protein AgCh_028362 [Apium graveolens]